MDATAVVLVTMGAVTVASILALAWRAGRHEWRGYPPPPAAGVPQEVHHHWNVHLGPGVSPADVAGAAEIIRRHQARGEVTEGKE